MNICRSGIFRVALIVPLLVVTHVRAQSTQPATTPARPSTGTLTYPAVDNVDFREGTIECWIKLAFDPAEFLPTTDLRGLSTLLAITGEDGAFNVHYYAPAKSSTAFWWCSIGPKSLFTPFAIKEIVVKKGEWHHIAVTWKDNEMGSFFDGQKSGGSGRKYLTSLYKGLGAVMQDKPILFGDRWNLSARYVIDEVRISRIARSTDDLGFAGPLKPDPFTAILDSLDGDFVPDGKTPTQPTVILGGGGGTASSQCRFVEGKFGKGLSFFVPEGQP